MIIKGNVGSLKGDVVVPGDKSISHRSVILGSIAEGETSVEGFLAGEDCLASIDCFKKLGVDIKRNKTKVTIKGVGLNGLKKSEDVLYVGNSGTTIRIMSGILAAQPFISIVDGDDSIRKRPMKRVIEPLREMGALIYSEPDGKVPLVFSGTEEGALKGGLHTLKVASAQVKSALLLSGLYSDKEVTVKEPLLSRDHTERMLKDFGVSVIQNSDGSITMPLGQKLKGTTISVPGDISSAAFILAAAAIVPNSHITVKNVGLNPTRTGVIDVLLDMGADVTINVTSTGAEPIGDITVKYKELTATNLVKEEIMPRLIDEVPVIAVLAGAAKGQTVIKNAEELRVKESDRIELIVKGLKKFGIDITETKDGMIINGGNSFVAAQDLETKGDHRIAMAFAVAGLLAEGKTTFVDDKCIDVSFPGFAEVFNSLGADMKEGI